jgi:O-antigen ligase
MTVLALGTRRGASRSALILGVAVGLGTGLVAALGGGVLLVSAVVGVTALAASADRPDLVICLLVILVPFYGTRDLLHVGGLPSVTITRVVAVWSLVVIGLAIERQRQQADADLVTIPSDETRGTLMVWVCVFVTIMLFAGVRAPSMREGVQSWLDEYLVPFGGLLLVCRYRWSQREIDLVVVVYMVCACVWSALSLFEFLTRRSLFTADHVLPWASSGEAFGRTGGPFINPAFLGTAEGIALVVALVWLFRGGFPRRVAFVCIPMSAIGLTVSLTRASWLGAGAGVLLVLALTRGKRAGTTIVIIGGIVLGVVVLVSLLGTGFLQSRAESSSEVYNRLIVQNTAIHIVLEHPLIGIGADRFGTLASQDLQSVGSISGSYGVGVMVPHNSVLGSMVDGGFAAGLGLVVVILLLLGAGRRRLAGIDRHLGVATLAAIAVIAVNAMFIDMSLGPPVTIIGFIVIGIFLSTRRTSQYGAP